MRASTRFLLVASLLVFPNALLLASKPQQDKQPEPMGPARRGTVALALEVLTDTEGVDFNDVVRSAYHAVRKACYENIPPSVEKGMQGTNTAEFRLMRNGTIAQDSIRLTVRSRKDELDTASLRAVHEADQFKIFPEKSSQPYLQVRFIFYYNLKPPQR